MLDGVMVGIILEGRRCWLDGGKEQGRCRMIIIKGAKQQKKHATYQISAWECWWQAPNLVGTSSKDVPTDKFFGHSLSTISAKRSNKQPTLRALTSINFVPWSWRCLGVVLKQICVRS